MPRRAVLGVLLALPFSSWRWPCPALAHCALLICFLFPFSFLPPTPGEEFYEASPYEPVTSRLSDIFRLASIFSGNKSKMHPLLRLLLPGNTNPQPSSLPVKPCSSFPCVSLQHSPSPPLACPKSPCPKTPCPKPPCSFLLHLPRPGAWASSGVAPSWSTNSVLLLGSESPPGCDFGFYLLDSSHG